MRIQACLALIGITLAAMGCASRQAVPSPQPLQAAADSGADSGGAPAAPVSGTRSGEPSGVRRAESAKASNPALSAVPLALGIPAAGVGRAGNHATRGFDAGNGAAAREVPDGSDDDLIALRLRRAAENESDPKLKGKLWKEYVDYRSYTQRR